MRIVPDNFYARPNEWSANQLGHASVGIIACYWMSWLWRAAVGELPMAWIVLAAWAVIYLSIELPQGGGWVDTIEDIVWAVAICGAVVFWSRDVFAAYPRAFDGLFMPISVITILLAVGYSIRLWQAHKEGLDI